MVPLLVRVRVFSWRRLTRSKTSPEESIRFSWSLKAPWLIRVSSTLALMAGTVRASMASWTWTRSAVSASPWKTSFRVTASSLEASAWEAALLEGASEEELGVLPELPLPEQAVKMDTIMQRTTNSDNFRIRFDLLIF